MPRIVVTNGKNKSLGRYSDPWIPFMAEAPCCIAFIVSRLMFAFSRAKTCCSRVFFVADHLSRSRSRAFFRFNAAKAAGPSQCHRSWCLLPRAVRREARKEETGGKKAGGLPFLFVVTFRFAVAVKSSICFWRWASFFSSILTCSRSFTIEFLAASCFFLLADAPPPNRVPHMFMSVSQSPDGGCCCVFGQSRTDGRLS